MPKGKIIKAVSGNYFVLNGDKTVTCRARGLFRKQDIKPLVGDNVVYQEEANNQGYITDIEERKNDLIRPLIANVDQAFLVFSLKDPDYNQILLDRLLALVISCDIEPIVILTKIDLLDTTELIYFKEKLSYYEKIGITVIYSMNHDSIETDICPLFKDKISVFTGQTGVGKSSLLNKIDSNLELKVGETSKALGRGKHTTRHTELLEIREGYVADTPGFSSLEFYEMTKEELAEVFIDFHELSYECKYRNCLHINEPKCKVKEQLEAGLIDEERYQNYLKFNLEIQNRKEKY